MASQSSESRLGAWERLAPLTGVAAVALWVAGIFVIEGFGDSPDEDATAQAIVSYFEEDERSIYVGLFLFFLGTLLFVWFAASLRSAVAALEGRGARLASILFAGAVMKAVFDMAFLAPHIAGAFAANNADAELDAGAAQALWYVDDGFFVAAEFAAALFLVATAVAVLRWRVLPGWVAWVSILLALVLLVPPIGWAALIFGIPLWTLIVSLLLFRRGTPDAPDDDGSHTARAAAA